MNSFSSIYSYLNVCNYSVFYQHPFRRTGTKLVDYIKKEDGAVLGGLVSTIKEAVLVELCLQLHSNQSLSH